jgi:hypothetical protein
MQQHGYRTAPLQTARFVLKAVPRKKSDIVNFLKSLEFWEKHHASNYGTENAWFLSNLICLPENGLSVPRSGGKIVLALENS